MFEKLVPYLSVVWEIGIRQAYIVGLREFVFGSIVCGTGVILGLVVYKIIYPAENSVSKDSYAVLPYAGTAMLSILTVIIFFVGLSIISESANYLLNPEYQAVNLILDWIPVFK